MYRLKLKVIPSFKFIIGKDFIVQMFRESLKNLVFRAQQTAYIESKVVTLAIFTRITANKVKLLYL